MTDTKSIEDIQLQVGKVYAVDHPTGTFTGILLAYDGDWATFELTSAAYSYNQKKLPTYKPGDRRPIIAKKSKFREI